VARREAVKHRLRAGEVDKDGEDPTPGMPLLFPSAAEQAEAGRSRSLLARRTGRASAAPQSGGEVATAR
jgi:hypothetical protein